MNVKEGLSEEFQRSFAKASSIISFMKGYIFHQLKKCIEHKNHFILLVQWKPWEDHEIGFRKSPEYQDWKVLLHHFYEPFPETSYYI